jgi:hypothetical protein
MPNNKKGRMSSVYADDNFVHMWFNSPTGDSSDSQCFVMTCISNAQANEIVNYYRDTLNIPDWTKQQ